MKYLLLFCFFAYVTAYPDVGEMLSGSYVHLGPYDSLVKIGNLSKPYIIRDSKDLLAARSARQLIEELRRMFKVGIYTLPPLDPYFRQSLPELIIDKDTYISTGTIQLKNFSMTGAQRFKLDSLEVRLRTGRVDTGFTLPKINIEVDVNADVQVAGVLPIHLSGHLSLLLKEVSVLAGLQTREVFYNGNYHYDLVGQHSRLHAEDVALKFTNININDILKQNALGSSALSIPDIFTNLKNHLDRYAAYLVLQQSNAVLSGFTVEQVLSYLLPEDGAQ